MSKADNQTYIEGLKQGDGTVIRKIYTDFHQAIRHLVESNSGSAEDARDVFQEGLMLVYQKAQDPGFQLTSSFLTYFFSVCRNIWFNRLRKKSSSEVTLSEEITSTLTETQVFEFERNEREVLFRKKFLLLGEDCQKILSMFFQKIKMEKIMEAMGFGSVSYVKKRKFQCKEKLIKLIENDSIYKELVNS